MSRVDISPIPRIARHADFHGERTALIYEDETVSFGRLFSDIRSLASAFTERGVRSGDRVMFYGMNSVTLLVSYLASAWIGAAFIPVNFRLAAAEVDTMADDAEPTVLIAEPEYAAKIDQLLPSNAPFAALVVDTDPALPPVDGLSALWRPLSEFVAAAPGHPGPPRPLYDDDLAVLLYTSGTTGYPKGAMLSHGNLWWNSVNVDSIVDTRVNDTYLAIAPLFHIGGLNTFTLRAITRGAKSIIRRSFDPARTLVDLVEHRVNGMFVVPAMLAAVQREPGFAEADLTHLRSTIVAGAPVPPALISAYAEKGVYLQQAWGLTETSPFSTYLESGMTVEKRGSAGVAMPYTEVRVVDTVSGATILTPGVTGELWVRGPNVASGYWRNAAASAAAFVPGGWFRSGDIGYLDPDGYLFIVDRLKDMIITGGENVYPAEVERVLGGHPHLADVAVVSCPDPKWGEAVVAVCALNEGTGVTLEQIREFASQELAKFKLPTKLLVVDGIPRNGSGKLDKPAIRLIVANSELIGLAPHA